MKFVLRRISFYGSFADCKDEEKALGIEVRPCEMRRYVELKYKTVEEARAAGRDIVWMLNGKVISPDFSDETVPTVEINSLEELIDLMRRLECEIVVGKEKYLECQQSIEIYDTWRE